MRLTRRDAIIALGAIGVAGGIGAVGYQIEDGRNARRRGHTDQLPDDTTVKGVQQAMAEVVYPSEVSGIDEFVDQFVEGRLDGSDHAIGLRETIGELGSVAADWYQTDIQTMSSTTREQFLIELGTDTASEHPRGTLAERTRYFVVNELLLALYTSPTGGELVGLENPQGHPGGTTSYTIGPQ